jgi:nitrogen regulatory protein PII
MKKIEAIIDPETLEAVKLHLAEVGIGGSMTAIQASGLEDIARFYQFQASGESQWKPCLKLDLIVSDRQAHAAVNVILQYSKPTDRPGTNAHINILSLDASFSPTPEELCTGTKASRKPKGKTSLPNGVPPEISKEPSKTEPAR